MDDQMASLWKELETLGPLDDTLVLFWSDHGEQYWDHHQVGHGVSLYQEENRVLASFWAEGLSRGALRMPASYQDLAPTLFDVFGLAQRDDFTGQRFQDIESDRVWRAFRYNSASPVRFLVTQHDKTLLYSADGKKSLYDSAADPREVADIYESRDADLAVLWEELDQDLDRVLEYLPHLQLQGRGP